MTEIPVQLRDGLRHRYAIEGSYPLSRAVYRSAVAGRTARLESLAGRLAEQCEETAR